MSVSKAVVNKLEEAIADYETIVEMVEEVLDPEGEAPMIMHLKKNVERMEESFMSLSRIYKVQYRKEAVNKTSEESFNEKDKDGVPVFEYNADWYKSVRRKYADIINKSDERIEKESSEPSDVKEEVVEKEDMSEAKEIAKIDRLKKRIDSEKKSIKEFVSKIEKQVEKTNDGEMEIVVCQAFNNSLRETESRMTGSLQQSFEELMLSDNLPDSAAEETRHEEFIATQRSLIGQVIVTMTRKLKSIESSANN